MRRSIEEHSVSFIFRAIRDRKTAFEIIDVVITGIDIYGSTHLPGFKSRTFKRDVRWCHHSSR